MKIEDLIGKPDLTQAKRVLAIQPHYDDNDIAAGGTLAALADAGAEVYYLSVTDDLVGVIDQSLTEEEMKAQIVAEQQEAGAIIGVKKSFNLWFPDAGEYTHHHVRAGIVQHIRMLRPDFIFTCDPWTPYEAHRDHIKTGLAVAESVLIFNLRRIKTDPQVDAAFEPYELGGIAFYASAYSNTVFDISKTREKKYAAIACYRAQLSPNDVAQISMMLDIKERDWAKDEPFSHGEGLKVLRPRHLHVFPDAVYI
jgi:LmbE family N-acetylglucosaminyl deacetylase